MMISAKHLEVILIPLSTTSTKTYYVINLVAIVVIPLSTLPIRSIKHPLSDLTPAPLIERLVVTTHAAPLYRHLRLGLAIDLW